MKPSNNWTSTLIKLIQECPSETGDNFLTFVFNLMSKQPLGTSDQHLIKALKEML